MTTKTSSPKADSLRIKWFDHSQDYAVVYACGTVVEGHLPTAEVAGHRLAFHVARVRSIEEWDNAHRDAR